MRDDTLTAKGNKLTGYAVTIGAESVNLGGFYERIAPDALARTASERPDIRALVDHNTGQLIGRASSGTLKYRVDPAGLKVEIAAPDTQAGRDIVELVRRGDISGMSFAFTTFTDDWAMEGDRVMRTLHDIAIREVSVVAWPAYPSTTVSVGGAFRDDREASVERCNGVKSPVDEAYNRARIAQVREVAKGQTRCGLCRTHTAEAVRSALPMCRACLRKSDAARAAQFGATAVRRDPPHGRHSRKWWEDHHRQRLAT